MELPRMSAFAAFKNQQERFEKAIKTLEDGLANKHIWNVEYEEAKNTLSRLAEDVIDLASKPYMTELREKHPERGNYWAPGDPRWSVIYTPQFMNVPGAVKKLEKFENSEPPSFKSYVDALREIASVVDLIKAVKPFIQKGRKPSDNHKEIDLSNTGICPVCFKRQKLNFNGTLVAHGYTLNHKWGGRNGMCIGHGFPAFELSNEGTLAYIELLKKTLNKKEETLAKLKNKEFSELTEVVRKRVGFGRYEEEKVAHPLGTPAYENLRKIKILSTESDIRMLHADIKEYTNLAQSWEAKPLTYGGAETQERWKSKLLNKKGK